MCLEKVTRSIQKPSMAERIAYKVFYEDTKGRPSAPYFTLAGRRKMGGGRHALETGKWLRAKERMIGWRPEPLYRSGFHAYRSRKAAGMALLGGKVLKVRLKGVHTLGKDRGYSALVARYMYIPKPKKPKKPRKNRGVD